MAFLQDFFASLRFFTRLPLPYAKEVAARPLAAVAWAFPLAGAVIGLLAALVFIALLQMGLVHYMAAWLALAFQLWLTGALHEDGLADMADGLAGGRSREQKLAIMRDSRIGSYGVLALIVSVAVRAQAMAMFFEIPHILLSFMAIGALSRAVLVPVMRYIPFARQEGLGANAGKPANAQTFVALAMGLLFLVLAVPGKVALLAILLIATIVYAMALWAKKQLGGSTGDVLGSIQQVSEITLWIMLSA